MKEEEEKTKKKPNWALQVSILSMMRNCLKKSFTLQNSLSTVSLGKLGEDGGEEGLDVEEE